MFKDLRPNTPFFIFDKGDKTSLQQGHVVTVSQPMVKPQTNFNQVYPYQPEYVVDVRIKVGESIMNFNQLPANLSIADFPTTGNQKIVVSANRDLIRTEVESTMANSKTVLESISKHEDIVRECEKILQEINPSFAKDKEQEEEIKNLRQQVASMEEKLKGIDDIKSMILEQNKNSKTTK